MQKQKRIHDIWNCFNELTMQKKIETIRISRKNKIQRASLKQPSPQNSSRSPKFLQTMSFCQRKLLYRHHFCIKKLMHNAIFRIVIFSMQRSFWTEQLYQKKGFLHSWAPSGRNGPQIKGISQPSSFKSCSDIQFSYFHMF